MPGCVAQWVARLTQEPEVLGSIPCPPTYFHLSLRWFKKSNCQLLEKVLVNRLGGLSLPMEKCG